VIPLPVQGFAQMMRAAGGPTHIWTINDPARAAQLWRDGINGIISDDPALMLRTRETLH
jgi:glycerophosphoryl diester phosphodiesterase